MMQEHPISKDLTLREFERFRDYIHEHSGIYLEEGKVDSLRISLVTRATRHRYESLEEYFSLLSEDEEEFKELLNLVTINETSFYRFPAQFDAMRTTVIPEILEGRGPGKREFRVWSAGCSTGEEVYTAAMTLIDSGIQGLGWTPTVLGTDVSTKALRLARGAIYSGRTLLNLPDDVLSRHFEETREGQRVAPHVRRLCDFGYHNLIKEPYPLALMGNWDIIFCRNVTIYFQIESTKRVVTNFHNSLNEGGYLFIGHSETLTGITDLFEPLEIGGVFLYRKPRKSRSWAIAARARSLPSPAGSSQRPGSSSPRPERSRVPASVDGGGGGSRGGAAGPDLAGMLAEARRLAGAGEPRRVLDVARGVLAIEPNCAEAHVLASHAYADVGSFDEALGAAHQALATDPLEPNARYILGIIYQRQGDTVRAISEFRKTIYIDQGFALAYLNLGNIYKSQGRLDDACREYELALAALRDGAGASWASFLGGFDTSLLVQSCERSLIECRKAT